MKPKDNMLLPFYSVELEYPVRDDQYLSLEIDIKEELLSNEEGFTTLDFNGYIHMLVWPSKEFAEAFDGEETPIEVEIHDFCKRCEEIKEQKEIRFMIFPNHEDGYIIETEELLNDILEELELIE